MNNVKLTWTQRMRLGELAEAEQWLGINDRTSLSLVKRGLAAYRGRSYLRITDAGRAALTAQEGK